MKKLLLVLIAASAVTAVQAQYYKTNIFGVRAGLNASTQSLERTVIPEMNVSRTARLGWRVGVSDQILLNQRLPFYLETGLYLSNVGSNRTSDLVYGDAILRETAKIGITYLHVPLRFNYHFEAGDFTIEPYAGFHYGLGLWARRTRDVDPDGPENLFKDKTLRRSDVGVGLGIGGSWSDFYAALGWERGFLNLSRDAGMKIYNASNFTVTVGYNF